MSGMNDIELLLCVGMLVFLVWKEVRAGRPRVGWRVAATVVAVAALLGLILPLRYRRRVVETLPVSGTPGKAVEGVVSADWTRRLYTGERLVVHGRWQGREGAGPVKLLLIGFGTVVDSGHTEGEFSLSVVPPQTGKAVYRLAVVRERDTIEQEEIPVEVGHGQPMKVLILAASPDFENTFLVNWLAKNGQQVAVRTMVSRDRYQISYVNMKPRPLDRLTGMLLDGFDVIIADSAVMGPEGPLLRREVKEKGLGLIVRTDSGLVRKTLLGTGKAVYTAQDTTYVRMMAGQSAGYASYWADLLRRVGKRAETVETWNSEPEICVVGENLDLSMQANEKMPQGVMVQGGRPVSVYLAEDEVLPFIWRGRYWPEEAGWVTVNDSGWLYVWPRGSWPAMRRVERSAEPARAGEERVPVPKFWMYAAFLISVFFLWVERKFS
jgi:hypothetical protein